jgi:dTDP-glucose pyrophosphorylase
LESTCTTPLYFRKFAASSPPAACELEITDVNNFYLEEGSLTYEILGGWWTDAGTFESLLRANNVEAETGANKMSSEKPAARVLSREVVR